jgi:hypothetical protein
VRGSGIAWLGNKIKGSQCQRFERRACAFRGQRAYHDHRNSKPSRDLAQRLQTVHAWHFQVERHHIRTKVFNLLESKGSVHCRAYDLNFIVPGKDLWNQLSHQCGIIHHQDS